VRSNTEFPNEVLEFVILNRQLTRLGAFSRPGALAHHEVKGSVFHLFCCWFGCLVFLLIGTPSNPCPKRFTFLDTAGPIDSPRFFVSKKVRIFLFDTVSINLYIVVGHDDD